MSGLEQARAELAKISSLVQTAHHHVAGGTLVDLSALEGRVRTVVRAIEAMPAEERPILQGEIEALLQRLDFLGGGLTDCLDRIRTRLDGA